MNMRDIMLLKTINSMIVVLMEIPSGYLGDVIGRRKTLIIGMVFVFIAYIIYSSAYSFFQFIPAEIAIALGFSFISGSDSAILYDSLLSMKQEKDYVKYEGRISGLGNFSEAIAAIIGGGLAYFSLRYPYYVATVIMFINVLIAFSLTEPPNRQNLSRSENLSNVTHAFRISFRDDKVKWYILFSCIAGTATLLMAWFVQNYFELAQIPIVYYGVLWTLLNLIVGISSWYVKNISDRISNWNISLLVVALVGIGYIGPALSPFPALGLVLITMLYIGRGIATPFLKNLIHTNISSELRATILSIRSFIIRSTYAVVGLIMGSLTDLFSIKEAFLLAGCLFLGSIGFVLMSMRRRRLL